MRVSPCAFAHVEAECTPVARMSEATSGIPFRLYPHVAPLMRATVWGSRSSPYNALRHCLRQTRSVCAGSKATKQSSFVVEAGLLRCARNDGGLSAPARDVGAKQSFVASTGHTTSEGATQSSTPHEVVSPQPQTRGKCGERRNIIRSDDGRASGSRSLIPDETQSGFASGALWKFRSFTTAPPQRHHRDSHEKNHSGHCSRRSRLYIGTCRRSRRAGSLFQGSGDGGCCQQLERVLYRRQRWVWMGRRKYAFRGRADLCRVHSRY